VSVVLAAALAIRALALPTAPPDVPPLPGTILARYAEALATYRTPAVLSFEYAIDQTGARSIQQTHRIFRDADAQRDELLSADGKRLDPPSIHIFLGRRNRYTVEALAPRASAYAFRYVGSVHDGRHVDYVFATTPFVPRASTVTAVTIDGVRFLPDAIRFSTSAHGGTGVVTFGAVQKYWMPLTASAQTNDLKLTAQERILFSRYRFPIALAASTFSTPKPLPSFRPVQF